MKKTKKRVGIILSLVLLVTGVYIPQDNLNVVQAEEQVAADYTYRRVEEIINPEASSEANHEDYKDLGPEEAFDHDESDGYKWHTYYSGSNGTQANKTEVYSTETEVPLTYADLVDKMGEQQMRAYIGGAFRNRVLLGEFGYLGRYNNTGTWIKQYALYVANVAEGTEVTDADYKLVKTSEFTPESRTTTVKVKLDTPVYATHFRLVAFTTNGNEHASAAKIEMYEVISRNGYKNIASGATITKTSSAEDASGMERMNLVDGDDGTLFQIHNGAVGSDQSVMLTLEEAKLIDGFRIAFEHGDNETHQYTYSIFASSDDSDSGTWDIIVNRKVATRSADWDHRYLLDAAKSYKVIKITVHDCTYNGVAGSGWVSIAEFEMYGEKKVSPIIEPNEDMDAFAGSSHDSDHKAAKVLDNNVDTGWHTEWNNDVTSRDNHWIAIDLGKTYVVDGLQYLSRGKNSVNGIITEYKIYYSLDGKTYKEATHGYWEGEKTTWYEASYDPVCARYVKLKSENSKSDNSNIYATAQEIRIRGYEVPELAENARVSYYSFDDVDGTTLKDSWGDRDGVLSGSIVKGKDGNALSVTEAGKGVKLNGTSGLGKTWTISYWVNTTADFTDEISVVEDAEQKFSCSMKMAGDRNAGFRVGDNSGDVLTFEYNFSKDTWYNITWTQDTTTGLTMYVNGQKVAANNWTASNNINPPIDIIGGTGFIGLIDEVKIYDVVLDTEQIKANMLTAADVYKFRGGSLRMDLPAETSTNLRFGYYINDFNDAQVNEWEWKWGFSDKTMNNVVKGKYYSDQGEKIGTNLVITGVPSAYYDTPIYTQLTVTYILSTGEKVVFTSDVACRATCEVARNAISEKGNTEGYLESIEGKYMSAIVDACTNTEHKDVIRGVIN